MGFSSVTADNLGAEQLLLSMTSTLAIDSVTITGTPQQGTALTAIASFVDPDGQSGVPTFQWLADGAAITGATSASFTPGQAQVGTAITVRMSFTDDLGTLENLTSAPTAPVANMSFGPQGGADLTGATVQGGTLNVDTSGLSDPDGLGPLSFTWSRLGSDGSVNSMVQGATGASLTLTQAEVGFFMQVTVSYVDGDGVTESSVTAPSAIIANVNDPATGSVTISGTAALGQTLTASAVFDDPDGFTSGAVPAFQWFADEAAITGATGTSFTPGQAQVGAAISVRMSFTDDFGTVESLTSAPTTAVTSDGLVLVGTNGADTLTGGAGYDDLTGLNGDDVLRGNTGNDTLLGGDGADTLNGGDGDDSILGGETGGDQRDLIFGGDGDDFIDGGFGNDEINGMGGNDTLLGGFGADTVVGGDGDDVITGSAFSDLIFGNAGADFVNGGFGHDRVNGGAGGDKFFHLGILDHGSDWIQDFSHTEGDVLLFGQAGATASQFQVNLANTPDAGSAAVADAFVIYIPTGQIIWALVDGGAQTSINLQIAGSSETFDLLG
jgi:Ca2+-binding RTX toxin-like protein